MKQYINLLHHILENGARKDDRTGVGTISVFGYQMRFDLRKGFPLLTTKKIHFKSVVHELLWFLSGDTNVKYLQDNGVHIWDEWADENGDLGPIYSEQWRRWLTHVTDDGYSDETRINKYLAVDQILMLINDLKGDPDSRRMIVSAWNPGENPFMALAPCHCFFQCYVVKGRLSLQVYIRSSDVFLGCPFNIASYALLTHMLAHQCDLKPAELIVTIGDAHLYLNHQTQAQTQLQRIPRELPTLSFARKPESIFDYRYDDIILDGYDPAPAIKAEVAV